MGFSCSDGVTAGLHRGFGLGFNHAMARRSAANTTQPTIMSETPNFHKQALAGRQIRWSIAGTFWLGGVVAGFVLLARYDFAAGAAGAALPRWPVESRIPLSGQGPTLIMFAHPRCPCTRASLGELEKLVAHCPEGLTAWVALFQPAGAGEAWAPTDLHTTAGNIPGVRVLDDIGGAEAQLFHAMTSGHTVLFGPSGEQLFSGGMTVARGHAGDNDGRSALEAILNHATPGTREAPVYGCPIIVPAATEGRPAWRLPTSR
jgi:hypothetical protein